MLPALDFVAGVHLSFIWPPEQGMLMGNGKSGGVKQEVLWYSGTHSNPISYVENRDRQTAAELKNADMYIYTYE